MTAPATHGSPAPCGAFNFMRTSIIWTMSSLTKTLIFDRELVAMLGPYFQRFPLWSRTDAWPRCVSSTPPGVWGLSRSLNCELAGRHESFVRRHHLLWVSATVSGARRVRRWGI